MYKFSTKDPYFNEVMNTLFFESGPIRQDRPITTLFMLMSVDGKISTGCTDRMDVDSDFPKITGVKEGLQQYYDIEMQTDLWSFNTGRVQAKVGVNQRKIPDKRSPVSFVVLDNHHLMPSGVEYFMATANQFVLVTTNKKHPAFKVKNRGNMSIIYQERLDLNDMLIQLKRDFGCDRITIQSGGTINSIFLREKLFDYLDIVVAPILIGGTDTATLIDGLSLQSPSELFKTAALKLESCKVLQNSYLRLRYKVIS